jgi:hypothetical protein
MSTIIVEKILSKIKQPDLVRILSDDLTGSELNTLLLEIFHRKALQLKPQDLLRLYQHNRFVKPSDIDVLKLHKLENIVYKIFHEHKFNPVELSPVAQLGSCSVVAPAHQHKVISALRGTEVLADATNSLALHIADLKQQGVWKPETPGDTIKLSAIHRHVRAPEVNIPGFTQHFKTGCLTTSGHDTGNFTFEKKSLADHIAVMESLYKDHFKIEGLKFRFLSREGYDKPQQFIEKLTEYIHEVHPSVVIERPEETGENNYYKGLQYKIIIPAGSREFEIGDGGFVDWTQQLLGNRKERMLITGIGIELMLRLVIDKEFS